MQRLLKLLRLRKVYTIGFACDQTLEYWRGYAAPHFTFLGKEAWRSPDKAKAQKLHDSLEADGFQPMLSNPCWEFTLNREDWTW